MALHLITYKSKCSSTGSGSGAVNGGREGMSGREATERIRGGGNAKRTCQPASRPMIAGCGVPGPHGIDGSFAVVWCWRGVTSAESEK